MSDFQQVNFSLPSEEEKREPAFFAVKKAAEICCSAFQSKYLLTSGWETLAPYSGLKAIKKQKESQQRKNEFYAKEGEFKRQGFETKKEVGYRKPYYSEYSNNNYSHVVEVWNGSAWLYYDNSSSAPINQIMETAMRRVAAKEEIIYCGAIMLIKEDGRRVQAVDPLNYYSRKTDKE